MIYANNATKSMISSPVRKINARVEIFDKYSTLVDVFSCDDTLMNFTIERVCEEGKFFGFGICQHVKVKILDTNRRVNYITTSHSLRIIYDVNGVTTYAHPRFYITQARRDEKTNELTIYGYDLIYQASKHKVEELNMSTPYSIRAIATACALFLSANDLSIQRMGTNETSFDLNYENGANFEGTELIRDVLDDIAEATQTIYFVNYNNNLVFKRLSDTINPDLSITKSDYIELDTKDGKRLGEIVSVTELGDNYSASTATTGSTQYVRENAFWTLRDDVGTLVDNAIAAVGGLSIRQFDCSWRGNFLLEPGDKIELTAKNNTTFISYVLDDVIDYNGAFQERTQWNYSSETEEVESNPTSLGDILKNTTAKVDKANQNITLAVSKMEGQESRLTALELNTDGISASVQQVQTSTESRLDAMGNEIDTLTNRVEATMTPEAIEFKIQEALGDGVNKVVTETGFRFDDEGLTVSKSGSEMTTTINEDGMIVYKDGTEVLTADNTGVHAIDLRAETYLHIGTYSRFQDYGEGRTGCFWIV